MAKLPKLKTTILTIIEEADWSKFVRKVYNRPYQFQQQDRCYPHGYFRFSVPDESNDFDNDTIPEIVNHEAMGVSFEAWLARDPAKLLPEEEYTFSATEEEIASMRTMDTQLWWHRNFYPDFQTVANDLHSGGLIDAGDYTILIG